MHTPFTNSQIQHFKREAKKRRRANLSLTHSEALEEIAQENGWNSWALLAKHQLEPTSNVVQIAISPYPNAAPGVFKVELNVVSSSLLERLADQKPSFELPVAAGWLFRPSTTPQNAHPPYLDLSRGSKHAIFVGGHWEAILSRNGIQDAELDDHVATTRPTLLRELVRRASAAILPILTDSISMPGGRFRLFYSSPQSSGIDEIAERSFATLDEAKNAKLPIGCQKVGIPTSSGWLFYQDEFGWQQSQ